MAKILWRWIGQGRVASAFCVLSAMLTLVGWPACCSAQVQLPTVNLGLTNFEDGFAIPCWFLQEFPDYYDANHLKDAAGNNVLGQGHVSVVSTTTHIVFVSQRRFLGGWPAFEILQPWVDLDVRAPNGAVSKVHGPADVTVGGGLQWAPVKVGSGLFAQRFILDVTAPTGNYRDDRAANIGNHYYVVEPYYAVTFERDKFEVSARFHYFWNSVNHDPFLVLGAASVQPGQAVHVNYAMSYEIVHNVRAGFNGYWLQQVTDHQLDGTNIPHSLERTVGLGGGIQYFFGRSFWLHLNAYKETDVRNRAQGFSAILRASWLIPRGL
jgi:hypothetical protein